MLGLKNVKLSSFSVMSHNSRAKPAIERNNFRLSLNLSCCKNQILSNLSQFTNLCNKLKPRAQDLSQTQTNLD